MEYVPLICLNHNALDGGTILNISNAFFTVIPSFHHCGNAPPPVVVSGEELMGNEAEAVSGEEHGQTTSLCASGVLEVDLSENLQFS